MRLTYYIITTVLLAFGTTGAPQTLYELKVKDKTCLSLNTTITVGFFYERTDNKTKHTSWQLGKPASAITGQCDFQSPSGNWSQLTINASGAIISLHFVRAKSGAVSIDRVNISVYISNGTKFLNPKVTGWFTFTGQPNFPLSAEPDACFVCRSAINLNLTDSAVSFTKGVVMQAFNMKDGKLSGKVAQCQQDATTTQSTTTITTTAITTTAITTTAKPVTVTPTVPPPTPSSEPPILNFTLINKTADTVCLRLRARILLTVPYLVPGDTAIATVAMREDAVASGACGDSVSRLSVKFLENWNLTLVLTNSGTAYSLTSAQLDYNLRNASLFPHSSFPDNFTAFTNDTKQQISGVPANGYYACSKTNVSLSVASSVKPISIVVSLADASLQAFARLNRTEDFQGDRAVCSADIPSSTDMIVPIAVGAALGGLVLIVLVAYVIGRRRQTQREGYQSV